jgi:hypothetical protein
VLEGARACGRCAVPSRRDIVRVEGRPRDRPERLGRHARAGGPGQSPPDAPHGRGVTRSRTRRWRPRPRCCSNRA